MIIYSECYNLRLKHFDVVNFYGVETCFAWDIEKLVVFPYQLDTLTVTLPLIVAPKPIRSIHSYAGRVFIVCKPCGIYKFKKNHEFVAFTTSAVGICAEFYEVLKLKDNYLYLNNICKKTSKQLFKLSDVVSNVEDINELCTLVIRPSTISNTLKRILSSENGNVCMIANGKKLFKVFDENTQLVYSCQYNIIDVVAIDKDGETVGLLLKTDSHTIIVAFVHNNTLCFKTIDINSTITTPIVGFLEGNEILIVCSDNGTVQCLRHRFDSDTVEKISPKTKKVVDLRSYKSKILGLTNTNELFQLEFSMAGKLDEKGINNYCELKSSMLEGSGVIVENICDQATELNDCAGRLLIEQDKLKRVNIFAHKQRMPHFPKIHVNRTAGCVFLVATFDFPLPQNCNIFFNLTSGNQTQFSSKLVDDREITVEMPLVPEMLESTLNISIDLVTFSEKNQPWCLIRNCIKAPTLRDRARLRQMLGDKKNFLNVKLSILRSMTQDGNSIDMKELSNFKKTIRRDIPNL